MNTSPLTITIGTLLIIAGIYTFPKTITIEASHIYYYIISLLWMYIGIILIIYSFKQSNKKEKKEKNDKLSTALSQFSEIDEKFKNNIVSISGPVGTITVGSTCYNVGNGNNSNFTASVNTIQTEINKVVNAYNGLLSMCKSSIIVDCFVPSNLSNLAKNFIPACLAYGVVINAPGVSISSQIPTGPITVNGSVKVTDVIVNGKSIPSVGGIYACPDWCSVNNTDSFGDSKWTENAEGTNGSCLCPSGYYPTTSASTGNAVKCMPTNSNNVLTKALSDFNIAPDLMIITPTLSGSCGTGSANTILNVNC
jgi:hypothetical protein